MMQIERPEGLGLVVLFVLCDLGECLARRWWWCGNEEVCSLKYQSIEQLKSGAGVTSR
jgi:hypothetical protein